MDTTPPPTATDPVIEEAREHPDPRLCQPRRPTIHMKADDWAAKEAKSRKMRISTRGLPKMTRPTRGASDMTLRLHVVSDLHVEFGNPIPAPVEDADFIALAGDLAPYRPAVIRELARAWGEKRVFYVPGNHEFYGGDIDHVRAALARQCLEVGIDLLDRASKRRAIVKSGVRQVGHAAALPSSLSSVTWMPSVKATPSMTWARC